MPNEVLSLYPIKDRDLVVSQLGASFSFLCKLHSCATLFPAQRASDRFRHPPWCCSTHHRTVGSLCFSLSYTRAAMQGELLPWNNLSSKGWSKDIRDLAKGQHPKLSSHAHLPSICGGVHLPGPSLALWSSLPSPFCLATLLNGGAAVLL